jgi:hypothetical protein
MDSFCHAPFTKLSHSWFVVFLQFQSHQIFHVLVVAAAFVHFHGISEMAMYRMSVGSCDAQNDPPLNF